MTNYKTVSYSSAAELIADIEQIADTDTFEIISYRQGSTPRFVLVAPDATVLPGEE